MRCALLPLEAQARPASRIGACRCQPPSAPPLDRPDPPPPLLVPPVLLLRSAALLSAVAASNWLVHCDAASAAAGRGWRPRRHHRRLGQQEREPDLGRYAQVSPTWATPNSNQWLTVPFWSAAVNLVVGGSAPAALGVCWQERRPNVMR